MKEAVEGSMKVYKYFSRSSLNLHLKLPVFQLSSSTGLQSALAQSSSQPPLKSLSLGIPIKMRASTQVLASILAFAASALGDAAPGSVASTAATPTASVSGHDPANLPALYTPPPGPVPEAAQLSGAVTIGITNKLAGNPTVTIVGANDAGAKTPIGGQVNGQFTATTNIVVPSGWAGAFTLDKTGSTFNTLGSRIEGNWGVNDPYNQVYLDVSYVTGFSVPIVCSCGTNPTGNPVTGCNKNLFDLSSCPSGQLQGNSASPVCANQSPNNGPPQAFFAPVSNIL